MAWTCPQCGQSFGREHPLHERVCYLYPGEDQLRDWTEAGWSTRDIADECDVGREVVRDWLRRIGLWPGNVVRRQLPGRQLDLVRHLRVRKCQSCESCDDIDVCRRLDQRGTWVLCEMPERDFVKLCIRQGLVPADILEAVPAAG